MMDWSAIGHAFFLLIVIMGPLSGLPVFIRITSSFSRERRLKSANRAIKFSAGLLLFFLFLGEPMLKALGVGFESFRVAGGIILLILGLMYMFHFEIHSKHEEYSTDILVPFATPLIVGPGVITTSILLVHWYGLFITFLAAALSLFVYWLFLRFSTHVVDMIGRQGIEVVSRLSGLIILAIAVEMIRTGLGMLAG